MMQSSKIKYHTILANYFDTKDLSVRKIKELPWQLSQGKSWENLFRTLSSPHFFIDLWEDSEDDVIKYWKLVEKSSSFRVYQFFDNLQSLVWNMSIPMKKIKQIVFSVIDLLYYLGEIRLACDCFQMLQEVFQLTNDNENIQACLGNQANCYIQLKEYDMALAKFQEQEKMARLINNHAAVVNSVCGQAIIYGIKGLHETALKILIGAENFSGEKISTVEQATYLSNLGITLFKLKRFDEAITTFRQAEILFRSKEKHALLLQCLWHLSQSYEEQGNIKEAIEISEEAVLIAKQEGNKKLELDILFNQASMQADLKNLLTAEKLYAEMDPLCRQLNMQYYLVASLGFRAGMLSEQHNQNENALPLAEEAYKLAKNLGEEYRKDAWIILSNIRRALSHKK